jgi:hypothetical protein
MQTASFKPQVTTLAVEAHIAEDQQRCFDSLDMQ